MKSTCRLAQGSAIAISLYSAVNSNVKGEGSALTESRQHHVLAAPQHLCLLFNEVANNLHAAQRHQAG